METNSCQSRALKLSPATPAACPTALPQTHPDIRNEHRCNRMLSHDEADERRTCLQQTSKALELALRFLEAMGNVGDKPPSRRYFPEREVVSYYPSAKMATRNEKTLRLPLPSHCCLRAAQSASCAAERKHPAEALPHLGTNL